MLAHAPPWGGSRQLGPPHPGASRPTLGWLTPAWTVPTLGLIVRPGGSPRGGPRGYRSDHITTFGGARGAEYKVIDDGQPMRKRAREAEKSLKQLWCAYACTDHSTIIRKAVHFIAKEAPQAALRTLHVTLDETTHEAWATVLLEVERRGYAWTFW